MSAPPLSSPACSRTSSSAAPGGGRFRFVWIGAGYDPETDNRGSALLADQISRAGIGGQLRGVGAGDAVMLLVRSPSGQTSFVALTVAS